MEKYCTIIPTNEVMTPDLLNALNGICYVIKVDKAMYLKGILDDEQIYNQQFPIICEEIDTEIGKVYIDIVTHKRFREGKPGDRLHNIANEMLVTKGTNLPATHVAYLLRGLDKNAISRYQKAMDEIDAAFKNAYESYMKKITYKESKSDLESMQEQIAEEFITSFRTRHAK